MRNLGAAALVGLLLAAAMTGNAFAKLPKIGDKMHAIPGQPICSNVDELVVYIREQMGADDGPHQFKTCGPMPDGTAYTIVQVSADDPEIPVRPARIKLTAPGGASITGWTVLVSGGE